MNKLLLGTFVIAVAAAQTPRAVTDAEVARVHQSALLIDTHNDVTSFTVDGMDIGKPQTKRHTDLAKLKQGGVGAVFFAVYVGAGYVEGNHAAHRTLEMIDTVKHDIAARYPNQFQLATTAGQIEVAKKDGKIAVLLGIEGGHAIEDSLRLLRTYYDLGVRYMTLTHSNSNNWADSSGDAGRHNGLTPFGKQVDAGDHQLFRNLGRNYADCGCGDISIRPQECDHNRNYQAAKHGAKYPGFVPSGGIHIIVHFHCPTIHRNKIRTLHCTFLRDFLVGGF